MDDCIFCKIIKGDLPSYKIYEDDLFYGLLDINPASKGHALLIPKTHYTWVHDVPQFGKYWETALKIKQSIDKVLLPKWVQYLTHGVIPHAHIHIIPRYEKVEDTAGKVLPGQGKEKPTKEEMEELAEKIRKA